ncbi:hypothetical protein SB49_02860 [Sediminicola sp. YIK13]|uniref:Rossmann-like and DUF2520 domain-containing protein n=1 Tax=Sediminicola sp. YIK13 TaxID=1453352 RepID=UPI00071F3EF9|nr:Rossmann-like and DUF2520 domain-containing protein [Sediminicola sp. YIK13]ALM06861.1 hypothetical protein SB49_02860 [Sediminicola sp. YIK13]
MISIVILGTGNVAKHLYDSFSATNQVKILQVVGRSEEKLLVYSKQTEVTLDYGNIKEADVYLIAVSDGAVKEVSQNLIGKKGLVVHTSGNCALDMLSPIQRKGVFYPLQSFTKNKKVDFKEIPICLEAAQKEDEIILEHLAHLISEKVFNISSEQRKIIHLAAVFVNNFTNHLYQIGNEICNDHNIPFELLHPLIKETAHKISVLNPHEAQTGPARRGDQVTINNHLRLLENKTYKEIYSLLSNSIKKNYE